MKILNKLLILQYIYLMTLYHVTAFLPNDTFKKEEFQRLQQEILDSQEICNLFIATRPEIYKFPLKIQALFNSFSPRGKNTILQDAVVEEFLKEHDCPENLLLNYCRSHSTHLVTADQIWSDLGESIIYTMPELTIAPDLTLEKLLDPLGYLQPEQRDVAVAVIFNTYKEILGSKKYYRTKIINFLRYYPDYWFYFSTSKA